MTIAALHDAIETLLTTDVTFVAGIEALGLGAGGAAVAPQVLRSNQPLSAIPGDKLPCWILEQGDTEAASNVEGEDSFLTIGNRSQGFQTEILGALVWNQGDRETAYGQRLDLFELLAGLALRNPSPTGRGQLWLARTIPDRAAQHPLHVWQFVLHAQFTQRRSA